MEVCSAVLTCAVAARKSSQTTDCLQKCLTATLSYFVSHLSQSAKKKLQTIASQRRRFSRPSLRGYRRSNPDISAKTIKTIFLRAFPRSLQRFFNIKNQCTYIIKKGAFFQFLLFFIFRIVNYKFPSYVLRTKI